MVKNKLGLSIPWLDRSNSEINADLKIIVKSFLRDIEIYTSDVYVFNYPKFMQIILFILIRNKKGYKKTIKAIKFLKNILLLLLKKNILIMVKPIKEIFLDVEIFHSWLIDNIEDKPLLLKKILYGLKKNYDKFIVQN